MEVAGFILGRHRQMVPLWLGVGALATWWVMRKIRNPQSFTPVLNLLSIFLLIYPSFQTISYSIQREKTEKAALAAAQAKGTTLPLGYAPDIYYIILDAYGRADVLQEMFGYDNVPFLQSLESRGFYVAECSQSNYGQTMLSLTSSLNFNYLDSLTSSLTPDEDTRAPLPCAGAIQQCPQIPRLAGIQHCLVCHQFPRLGMEGCQLFSQRAPPGHERL
jgi:hypothetical protein